MEEREREVEMTEILPGLSKLMCSEVKSSFTQIFNHYVRLILCSLSTITDNTSKFGGPLC